jgi:hypothetical protein
MLNGYHIITVKFTVTFRNVTDVNNIFMEMELQYIILFIFVYSVPFVYKIEVLGPSTQ